MTDLPKAGEVWKLYTSPYPKVTIIGTAVDKSRSGKLAVIFVDHGTLKTTNDPQMQCYDLETFTQVMSGGKQRYTKIVGELDNFYPHYFVDDVRQWLAPLPAEARLWSVSGLRKMRENEYAFCYHPDCPCWQNETECSVCEFHKAASAK